MPSTVAVVGDAVLDVHVQLGSPIRLGADTAASIDLRPGGQGANLAARLARRGVPVRLTCALADDAAGAVLREALEADGVALHALPAGSTGTVVVLVADDGERTMLSQRVPLLDGLDLPDAAGDATWLVLSGYALLEPGPPPEAAGIRARRAVIGCALLPAQAERWLSRVRALETALLVLNRDEASVLMEGGPDTLALARLVGAVTVVTDAGGASAAIGDREVRLDAPATTVATDTTGAGDAYAAGLVASLLEAPWPPEPRTMEAAMRAASVLAAAVAHVRGAQGLVAGERRSGSGR